MAPVTISPNILKGGPQGRTYVANKVNTSQVNNPKMNPTPPPINPALILFLLEDF
jgi:hypothetical protein